MLTSKTKLKEILSIAPEWQSSLDRLIEDGGDKALEPLALFERLGAKTIFNKASTLQGSAVNEFVSLVRDYYYQPMLARMLSTNGNLRRFWVQRRVDQQTQSLKAISLSVELASKLEQALFKQLANHAEDGFKVLLPAYAQRTVHNAVVDYVREEWQWEKDTLQDLNLDPSSPDPRVNVADDPKYSPENQAISGEQVGQLNELRQRLLKMLGNADFDQEPLVVVDCMYGMGLTKHSKVGVELTMRECCDLLNLKGDTQARKIARCQVLLDKGLNMIRDMIRSDMPGVAHAWQVDININSASRRELNHIIGFTEGEVDRLIANRQYYSLSELVEKGVVKEHRLSDVAEKGAVAAFIPVDLNSATKRDIIDVLGCPKVEAGKIAEKRPFRSIRQIVETGLVPKSVMDALIANGAVLRASANDLRVNINQATAEELLHLGLSEDLALRVTRGRPFGTWQELEEFLCVEDAVWTNLRERSSLVISSL
ncbi:MAG: general secretion pathway protein GspK [Cyanobacteria bacterium]|nr:general secretion pathway protein GspK [Cyanobacteriota bacterium]